MAFSSGNKSITLDDILKRVSEADLLFYYIGVTEIPCVICSPFRIDRHPSFSIRTLDGKKIQWRDFATKEHGNILDLFEKLWKISYVEVINKIWEDLPKFIEKGTSNTTLNISTNKCIIKEITSTKASKLECKIRNWQKHDINYWEEYGISKKWLQFADIYPISHKIIIKGDRRMVFGADKYAYAYVEKKEGHVTLKIYQPFNDKGFKWSNQHDGSVISLWTKLPEKGDKVCICASVKDALCLWANTGIPSIALQGEGYNISDTAIQELKKRFLNIYILFDNDKAGIEDGKKLSQNTGFINLVLPSFEGGKDISDMYKVMQNKELFQETIINLFKNANK